MQKLLTLIITILILYTIVQVKMDKKSSDSAPSGSTVSQGSASQPKGNESPEVTGNFIEKTLSSVLINVLKTEQGRLFIENIIQPANKPVDGDGAFKLNSTNLIKSMFKIINFGKGTKGPVSCGHIVTAHYKVFDIKDTLVEEQVKTFTLGSKDVMYALNAIIPGMKVGDILEATMPGKYLYKNSNKEGEYYKINVTLREVISSSFIEDKEVKVFDDEIAYKIPLVCGVPACFNAKITKLSNGKVIYNSEELKQKIQMNIGDLTYPMIFSYALHGKIPIGSRTVIAKGKTFKALGSVKINKIFPQEQLPEEEYFMLEFKNFD